MKQLSWIRCEGDAQGRRRGGALVTLTWCVVGMAGLATAMSVLALRHSGEVEGSKSKLGASYACQAALSLSMQNLQRGTPPEQSLGTEAAPVSLAGWPCWLQAADLDGGDIEDGMVRLTATARANRAGARQELVLRAVPTTIWRFGAFGKEFLHLDSNARVDSYDSRDGSYASQVDAATTGSNAHARQNGDVGSNGDISLDQNAKVWGDAMAGVNGGTSVLGNAVLSGAQGNNTTDVELPPISVPTLPSYGNWTVNTNSVIPASGRSYGTLRVGSSKTLTVRGPASIVASSLVLGSNSAIVVDDANGPVVFYVLDNFIMNSNATIRPSSDSPLSVTVNLLSDNVINPEVTVQLDTVDFDSNSKIWGTVYAPNARVVLDSNFELFGSLMARSLDMDSNATFHFDEALVDATANGAPVWETVGWREVPWRD
ncbi:MAG: hypothetical protein ACK57N_06145 [Planctomycetia bacterium]